MVGSRNSVRSHITGLNFNGVNVGGCMKKLWLVRAAVIKLSWVKTGITECRVCAIARREGLYENVSRNFEPPMRLGKTILPGQTRDGDNTGYLLESTSCGLKIQYQNGRP